MAEPGTKVAPVNRWAKVVLVTLGVLLGLAGTGFGTAVLYAHHVEGEVGRDDILGQASALPRITEAPEYVIVNGGTTAPPAAAAGGGAVTPPLTITYSGAAVILGSADA